MATKLLALRFGPLPGGMAERLRSASDAQFDRLAETLLTARTLEEALQPLY
jgi:hypothetical protein